MTSATPTPPPHEVSLPPFLVRPGAAAAERAADRLKAFERSRQARRDDNLIGPMILAALLFIAAILVAEGLIMRDTVQQELHQRDVMPEFRQ